MQAFQDLLFRFTTRGAIPESTPQNKRLLALKKSGEQSHRAEKGSAHRQQTFSRGGRPPPILGVGDRVSSSLQKKHTCIGTDCVIDQGFPWINVTREGRSAIFRVQGSVFSFFTSIASQFLVFFSKKSLLFFFIFFLTFFSFFKKIAFLFMFLFFFACVSFHFWFFLRFFTSGHSKGASRHSRSRHRPTKVVEFVQLFFSPNAKELTESLERLRKENPSGFGNGQKVLKKTRQRGRAG